MSQGFASQSGMDLFGLFVNNFDTQVIYELGWYAAQQWMVFVSAVVMALAIGFRMLEEKIALIGEGRSNYSKAVVNVIVIAAAIGLYFVIVGLVINFFNAIYGALDSSDALNSLTTKLDSILSMLLDKDYNFSWSDLVDSLYAVFATCTYAITYCILVFMILAMRVAHAVLVSFCVFWGAVALPMSISTGLKTLGAFKTLCLLALFWPIVDAFFMYLIGGSFSEMLDRSGLGLEKVDTWSMGTLLFYMAAFSIINVFIAATSFSAPFIAQAIATGSGNVTGMLGSFGTAALTAGAVASSYLKRGMNTAGNSADGMMKQGGEKLATSLQKTHGNLRGLSGGSAPVDTSKWFAGDRSGSSAVNMANPGSETPKADKGSSSRKSAPQRSNKEKTNVAGAKIAGGGRTVSRDGATARMDDSSGRSQEPSDEARNAARTKRRRQGRRGAILNQTRKTQGRK